MKPEKTAVQVSKDLCRQLRRLQTEYKRIPAQIYSEQGRVEYAVHRFCHAELRRVQQKAKEKAKQKGGKKKRKKPSNL